MVQKSRDEKRTAVASLTAEAALVMPVVLTALLFFVYLIQILFVEQELYGAAIRALRDTSACGYLLKYADGRLEDLQQAKGEYYGAAELTGEVLQGAGNYLWFQSVVKSKLSGQKSIDQAVQGGYAGISFWGSEAYAEDEMAVIRMTYKISFPLFRTLIPPIPFQKTIVMRSFSGEGELEEDGDVEDAEEEEKEEGYVYVTETGSVYHVNMNCTYIKLRLKSEAIGNLESLRNQYGGKYYPCGSCVQKGEEVQTVWVTETGTHYHYQKGCSKIKRNVKKITLEEAKNYRPCSRCAANGE